MSEEKSRQSKAKRSNQSFDIGRRLRKANCWARTHDRCGALKHFCQWRQLFLEVVVFGCSITRYMLFNVHPQTCRKVHSAWGERIAKQHLTQRGDCKHYETCSIPLRLNKGQGCPQMAFARCSHSGLVLVLCEW